jgi:2-polyprenyl-3-methyl-5-hydroxy-6-metoxy-1,4-benzoquinol methylase
VDPEYARRYRDLYNGHWWWRAREDVIVELLRTLRPPSGWAHILDIGCGGGVFFDRLAEFGDVRGVEPDATLVDDDPAVRRRIHIGPFDESYRPEHRFGLILMLDVVEHLDDPAAALRLALSMLEPDGVILLTVPAFRTLWTTHDDINQHRTRYTKRSMRALARDSGMRIGRMRYFFHWTASIKLAQRVVEAFVHPTPTPATIPPPAINSLLYRMSRAEHRLLTRFHLPFGSSLLVLGYRAK